MSILRQTYFLLRKNFQTKKRHKRLTLQEVIIPIYWVLILLVIRLTVKIKDLPAVSSEQIPRYNLGSQNGGGGGGNVSNMSSKPLVGVVTNNDPQAKEVLFVLKNLSSSRNEYKEFSSSDEMVNYYRTYGESLQFGMGIVFEKENETLSYTLRMSEGIVPDLKTKLVGLGKCHNVKTALHNSFECPANQYISNNIGSFQSFIDSAITKVLAGLPYIVVPNITAQMMPKRAFPQSIGGFELTVPIYMVMAFAPYITILLVSLVIEKEKKYKELLRIMGMKDTAYWLSWFLTYALIILLAVIIINAITVPAGVFGNSNFLLLVIVFYLYGLSLINFAFLLTPLFKNSMTAGTVANLSTIIFGVLLIPLNNPNVPNFAKWIACLLSPTAFSLTLTQAVDSAGITFSNISTKSSFPPSYSIIMMVVDIFLYLGLALYLDAVVPTEYGKRRPPYFIFMPSFWKSLFVDDKNNEIALSRQLSARSVHNQDDVEQVGPEMIGKEVISIHNIKKVFPGKEEVVAVDGFSMDIYEGQVTALLGHNGAGKSTLIAALTGMIEPTSGTALIYGKDITNAEDMEHIRRNIGVCPQQDVLFDFLTVEEHLDLYSGLKGVPGEERKEMISAVIKDIDLEDKTNDIAKNLSGGQKRKLCVGIALIANPKVLFLDEPTSGMDPQSRRQMWSLLQEQAKDKVVLLTTHFMDEADILADYKAIMTKGKLRCAGSSLFLKNRFGIGYHLSMELSNNCDRDTVESLVKSHVEGAEVTRHHGKELAFSLPIDQVNSFAGLFATLEDNNDSNETCAATCLGVTSYGVSMTTLEEVFLQLEDTSDEVKEDNNQPSINGSQNNLLIPTASKENLSGSQASNLHHTGVDLDIQEIRKNEGMSKYTGQLLALLKIQWLQTIRSPLKLFFMVIVPPILLVVGLVLIKVNSSDTGSSLRRVPISPTMYVTPASTQSYATPILFQNSTGSPLDDIYRFLKDYGIDFDQVNSLDDYLNISATEKPSRCFGLDANKFPTNNLSVYPKVDFHLRYNDSMVHSIPVGVNVITSLFNMFALKAKNQIPHPIKTYFQLFPALKPKLKYDNNSFIAVMLIGLSFAVIPGGFAILVVAQRQLNIRHLLRVSGLSTPMYWLYLFISDTIVFIIPAFLLLILVPAIQIPSLSSPAAMGCLVIAVILYIPTGILFSYCLSFLFSKWETCQQVLPAVFTYLSLIPFLAVSLVDMIASPDTAIILHYVFSFLNPAYGLIGAMYYVTRIYLYATIIANSPDVTIPASTYFKWTKHNGIPVTFIAMFVHMILLFFLLYFLDTKNTGRHKSTCSSRSAHKVDRHPSGARSHSSIRSDDVTEDDVKEEKEKILRSDLTDKSSSGFSVAVKGLWKKFGKRKDTKVVVKNLYFGVERGEVFGLLGPNGAGKTTTLNMITGAVAPSRGHVTITGLDMNTESSEIYQHVGYCPQTDALWKDLTLEEHLVLYAKIRGIPTEDVQRTVQHYMSGMRVTEHAKKKSKDLSGGTKRKLSFQMAMLGGPQLLLLDEPSTGLDPSARRFLWNTISKNVKGDRGAILTTHSMEEADALSSRVGIMVKGEMKCLGSTQRLKSKYGSGYSLEIKLTNHSEDAQTKLEAFVKELFPGAVLNEIFGGKATYKVPKDNVSRLSKIFDKLEQGKQTMGIEEYSFSQSTLEQVFLEFAREQDDDRTGEKDKKKEEVEELPPENPSHMV
ncbi:ATP-binding cassette sub-family A member 5-like [Actinia tenebrosa]|uniref:ATP-binding cassette sub-family A member 5-like n=1 Tax=Actinia tenebrosa TaxID=6105 RepID=A0A6P8IQQ2_ACTTE|nr:ATP-binding cassette sub-family A member 5-like [Actinia tenebrosa]